MYYSSFFVCWDIFFSLLFILTLFMHAVTLFTFYRKQKQVDELLTFQSCFFFFCFNLRSAPYNCGCIVSSLIKSLKLYWRPAEAQLTQSTVGDNTKKLHRSNSPHWDWKESLFQNVWFYICVAFAWFKHFWIPLPSSAPWSSRCIYCFIPAFFLHFKKVREWKQASGQLCHMLLQSVISILMTTN